MALLTNQSEILPGDSFWDVSEQVNPGITFLNFFRGLSGTIPTTGNSTIFSFTYTPDRNGKILFNACLTAINSSASSVVVANATITSSSTNTTIPVRGSAPTAEKSMVTSAYIPVGEGTGRPLGTPFTVNYTIGQLGGGTVAGTYTDATGFLYFSL